jgi:hypothetical protein
MEVQEEDKIQDKDKIRYDTADIYSVYCDYDHVMV